MYFSTRNHRIALKSLPIVGFVQDCYSDTFHERKKKFRELASLSPLSSEDGVGVWGWEWSVCVCVVWGVCGGVRCVWKHTLFHLSLVGEWNNKTFYRNEPRNTFNSIKKKVPWVGVIESSQLLRWCGCAWDGVCVCTNLNVIIILSLLSLPFFRFSFETCSFPFHFFTGHLPSCSYLLCKFGGKSHLSFQRTYSRFWEIEYFSRCNIAV